MTIDYNQPKQKSKGFLPFWKHTSLVEDQRNPQASVGNSIRLRMISGDIKTGADFGWKSNPENEVYAIVIELENREKMLWTVPRTGAAGCLGDQIEANKLHDGDVFTLSYAGVELNSKGQTFNTYSLVKENPKTPAPEEPTTEELMPKVDVPLEDTVEVAKEMFEKPEQTPTIPD